ncbi:MAG TPA: hypothetical protein VKY26_04455, partial [Actinomycetota bacterium]|nr:hypothetical protein [Actinomycetota bacterium]
RLWEDHPFGDGDHALDAGYLRLVAPERILALPDSSFYVATVGLGGRPEGVGDGPDGVGGWPNGLGGGPEGAAAGWHPHPLEEVRALLGADWRFYEELGEPEELTAGPRHR